MAGKKDSSLIERDILEWNIPEEVLAVLLKDRTSLKDLGRKCFAFTTLD